MQKTRICSGILVLLLLFSLFGCAASKEPDLSEVMTFPGLAWGMSPEEACSALSLSEGDYEVRIDRYYSLVNIRTAAYGADNARISLAFDDQNGDGVYTLWNVMVGFPHDTDMEAVKDAMIQLYGEPTEAVAVARATWESEALRQDIMSEEQIAFLRDWNEWTADSLTDPVTVIGWDTMCYPSFKLDGVESRNKVTLDSKYAFHVTEGGFTQQQMDEMKQAQEEALKG